MIDDRDAMKLAAISGAARAIRFKERNPGVSEQDVIQHVSDSVDEILRKIEEGEEGI